MTIIYAQLGEPLASEVKGALIELTALARKASWAASKHLDSVANDLLTCVLTLCKAERGAILLREDHPRFGPFEPASAAPEEAQAFRVLALHQMRVEEANALLAPMTTPVAPVPSPDMACWMVYRLSLDEGGPDEAQDGLAMLTGAPFDPADQAQHALLIIGRRKQQDQEHAYTSLLSRCSVLLPLVANAFEAVITSLLLKERVDELEREVVREALEGMELLKAELLGTVSHELRGPLASIKGYAATLLRHEHRLVREERHQCLLAINEASDRLEVIIERFLELSELETCQAALERSSVDMVRLASEAIAVIEERVTAPLPGRFVFRLIPTACARYLTISSKMRAHIHQRAGCSPSRSARWSRCPLSRKRMIRPMRAKSTVRPGRISRAPFWRYESPIMGRVFPPSNWNASLSAFTVLLHA